MSENQVDRKEEGEIGNLSHQLVWAVTAGVFGASKLFFALSTRIFDRTE
jgi:hypothetical protein